MKIIGLRGFIGAGKSTIGTHLIEKHGFKRISFASPVKDVAAIVFGWDRQMLDGLKFEDRIWRESPDIVWSMRYKRQDFTPREGLQLVGNGLRELIHPDVWVHAAAETIMDLPEDSKIVFDDVRYLNEVKKLRHLGARMFTVHRATDRGIIFPSDEHKRLWNESMEGQVLSNDPTPLHRSEWDWLRDTELEKDTIIYNDSTIEHLKEEIDAHVALMT